VWREYIGGYSNLIKQKMSSSPFLNDTSQILYVRNLPYKIENSELFELFGRYGPVPQIRIGNTKETRGTAYVIYENIEHSKEAYKHLSGFNLQGRYLIVIFWHPNSATNPKKMAQREKRELEQYKEELMEKKRREESTSS
jgi:pre-mRNA branch site protein p14